MRLKNIKFTKLQLATLLLFVMNYNRNTSGLTRAQFYLDLIEMVIHLSAS